MDLNLPDVSTATGVWSVIANVTTADGAIILAERYKHDSLVMDFVVAFVPLVSVHGEYASEWRSGRYFQGTLTHDNRQAARAHFVERVQRHWS